MIETRFASSDVMRQWSKVSHKAAQAPIAITKHGDDQLVIMSKDYFDKLTKGKLDTRRAHRVDQLPDELYNQIIEAADKYLEETK